MRWWQQFVFSLQARRAGGSRIASGAYLKGVAAIQIGRLCKVHDHASIDASRSKGVILGDQVTLNRYACVQGGDGGVRLGNRVEINNFSIVNGTGGVDIGDDTLIGPGVRIISYQHRFAAGQSIRSQPTEGKAIKIGRDCWIGANAVILAGVTVGAGAVVAAGAVVTRDVSDGALVAGVPAVVKKHRGEIQS
jgi:acetyltransferase-like isoleucine patch superfamily enzyme